MDSLKNDLRFALRNLRRNPGFTLVAVLTLALGIGANTAIFTVTRGVLLESLPFPHSDRVLWVYNTNQELGLSSFSLSGPDFMDFRGQNGVFESMTAAMSSNFSLTRQDSAPQRLSGLMVTADYLRVYGVEPVIGRGFVEDDDRPGAERVVVLNHGFWQRQFGGTDVLGSQLTLNGEDHEVIGMLPPGLQETRDFLVPLAMDYTAENRGFHPLTVFGRLAPGVTLEQADAELKRLAAALEAEYPDTNTGWSTGVQPIAEVLVEDIRPILLLLTGAVGLVLLIACANVANLLLVRMGARGREVALRSALGAGRWRLARQFFTESLVLAVAGGALGVLLAVRGTKFLVAMKADQIANTASIGVDGGVLGFALLLSLAVGLAFGLLPALLTSRRQIGASLKAGDRGQAGGKPGARWRGALVTAEVTVAVLLLVGAGLLIRSFSRLLDVDPGFDPEGTLAVQLQLPEARYGDDPERTLGFYRQVMERLPAIPGVEKAAAGAPLPLINDSWIQVFAVEGRVLPAFDQLPRANMRVTTGSYFQTLQIPLLRGRVFTPRDDIEAQRVIVINESTAERYWPGQDPLGQRVTFDNPEGEQVTWWSVIGIVGDVHHEALAVPTDPEIYYSYAQFPAVNATLLLHTRSDPMMLVAPVREELAAIDPELPLFNIRTLEQLIADSVAQPRYNSLLFGFFAALSLFLAILGVYGVVSYSIGQRRRELGVRLALGAPRDRLFRMVLAQGMRPVLIGVAIGLLAAFLSSRALASMVYEVSVTDAMTYVLAALCLAAVGAVACAIPALRATRINPVTILREE